jgi:hypothetical protein
MALPEIGDGVLLSALFQEYQAIFINVASWDGFQESDIQLNKLRIGESPPDFVVEFRQKLDRKPALSPDVRYFLDFAYLLSFPDGQCR